MCMPSSRCRWNFRIEYLLLTLRSLSLAIRAARYIHTDGSTVLTLNCPRQNIKRSEWPVCDYVLIWAGWSEFASCGGRNQSRVYSFLVAVMSELLSHADFGLMQDSL